MKEAPLKAAVLGHPIAHSLSPRLHGYWLKHYGIDGSYTAIDVAPDHLENWIKAMPELGYKGCNVTIPHKEKVAELMDELSPVANYLGVVNTVIVREDGSLYGDNTDAYGFEHNIRSHVAGGDEALQQLLSHTLILGAGGASRAVIVALESMGASRITITNRTKDKAEKCAAIYNIETMPWNELQLQDVTCVINTTSLGMKGQPSLELDIDALPEGALVTDIVYNPLITKLLRQARARDLKTITGIGMLLHQAVPGFEAWFGQRPQVTSALETHVLAGLE